VPRIEVDELQLAYAELVVFRNAGHTLNLEEPREFNTVVRRFLVQHSI